MSSSLARPTFSFVLPVFNEEDGLQELHARLSAVMDALDGTSEAILVDDGSTDSSFDVMREIRATDDRFKLLQFSRNFGHQAAITAGLDLASGEAAVIMDSDLQHPPEIVPQLISRWHEGFDIVNAAPTDRRGERRFKRLSARAFYWMLGKLARMEMEPNVGDFRLVSGNALQAFRSMRENTRYLRGMFSWVGFRQTTVLYDYRDRHAGRPKYDLGRMIRLGVDGIASFSQVPLQLALHVGFLVSFCSFVAGVLDLAAKILGASTVPGWLSVAITVSFLGGMQLLILGVMGTYMGRMYEEVKLRPLYIVRQLDGIEPPAAPGMRTVVVSVPVD